MDPISLDTSLTLDFTERQQLVAQRRTRTATQFDYQTTTQHTAITTLLPTHKRTFITLLR